MTYVVIGGSAGLGRSLASSLAAQGHDLVITASDERDVAATAADLAIRFKRRVVGVAADVADTAVFLDRLRHTLATMPALDGLLFPVGAALDGDDRALDRDEVEWLLSVNFTAIARTVGEFLPLLETRPAASIVGFGSIAAVRGRGRNIVYSAAKRALASLFESLRHSCAASRVRVQFYVLGYIDTSLAFGRQSWFPRGNPDVLSARVVRHLHHDMGTAYYPRVWRLLSAAVRFLPWPVYKRLSF